MDKKKISIRLVNSMKIVGSCWEWQLYLDRDGYAQTFIWDGVKSRTKRAARVAYMVFVGDIPAGLVIDHLCRNRACINPKHLEVVTIRENTRRGLTSTKKTHCRKGHKYLPDNIAIINRKGDRTCKKCRVESIKRNKRRMSYVYTN